MAKAPSKFLKVIGPKARMRNRAIWAVTEVGYLYYPHFGPSPRLIIATLQLGVSIKGVDKASTE